MEDNHNFDSTLGGRERLPHSANSLRFTAARSIEIAAMTDSILHPSKSKLIFQTLPVHMRRRVMSHNCKRLPRTLRDGHFEQLKKSGLPPKQKRPSRKYRRRPANLLAEYRRRQRAHKWLESHIWHAKRFHMVERWGYRLAHSPCDKAFRACYRASSRHCLLQDISYLECLQITADFCTIDSAFKKLTRPGNGLSVCARAFTSAAREGSALIYSPDAETDCYIGKVDFLWKPVNANESSRTLWLFVHPSFYKECFSACLKAFSLSADYTVPEKKPKLSGNNLVKKPVNISQLEQKLNRFRLTGPKSHALLTRALEFIKKAEIISHDGWVRAHGASDLHLEEKIKYWESVREVTSPGELPARLVLGAVVRDPRLILPRKRTKAQNNLYQPPQPQVLCNIPQYASTSPLWNTETHSEITANKWSDGQLIAYATKHQLVPGEMHADNPQVQSVPVILIQRPGSQIPNIKKLGYGSGWDIIIPASYSLAFWRSFIMWGGRAGGLRETESVARESGHCPISADCAAGRDEQNRICNEMKHKYFRLPPNKRVNYIKLGINSPFICRWDILTMDWTEDKSDQFYVMRNLEILKNMQQSLETKVPFVKDGLTSCLIPVVVKIKGKGNLSPHAIICLPQDGDDKDQMLSESCHPDPNEKERKQMRKEHKIKLKRLRRQRVRLKKSKGKLPTVAKNPKDELSEYTARMRELWLPSQVSAVRTSCDRHVMGYVCQAGFSFTEACSSGVGYVTSGGLYQLLTSGFNTVLVRNTVSRKYRWADITIIVNT